MSWRPLLRIASGCTEIQHEWHLYSSQWICSAYQPVNYFTCNLEDEEWQSGCPTIQERTLQPSPTHSPNRKIKMQSQKYRSDSSSVGYCTGVVPKRGTGLVLQEILSSTIRTLSADFVSLNSFTYTFLALVCIKGRPSTNPHLSNHRMRLRMLM